MVVSALSMARVWSTTEVSLFRMSVVAASAPTTNRPSLRRSGAPRAMSSSRNTRASWLALAWALEMAALREPTYAMPAMPAVESRVTRTRRSTNWRCGRRRLKLRRRSRAPWRSEEGASESLRRTSNQPHSTRSRTKSVASCYNSAPQHYSSDEKGTNLSGSRPPEKRKRHASATTIVRADYVHAQGASAKGRLVYAQARVRHRRRVSRPPTRQSDPGGRCARAQDTGWWTGILLESASGTGWQDISPRSLPYHDRCVVRCRSGGATHFRRTLHTHVFARRFAQPPLLELICVFCGTRCEA